MKTCKHLRNSMTRLDGGYDNKCLTCGHESFKADKPLTEAENRDKRAFERELAAGRID